MVTFDPPDPDLVAFYRAAGRPLGYRIVKRREPNPLQFYRLYRWKELVVDDDFTSVMRAIEGAVDTEFQETGDLPPGWTTVPWTTGSDVLIPVPEDPRYRETFPEWVYRESR